MNSRENQAKDQIEQSPVQHCISDPDGVSIQARQMIYLKVWNPDCMTVTPTEVISSRLYF